MMTTNPQSFSPSHRLLSAWRAILVAVMILPAFLCSFLLRVPSVEWLAAIGLWALLFLFLYLFYLPARWRGISLSVCEKTLSVRRGVFVRKISVMPLSAVRFTRDIRGPVGMLFGVCVLHIAAAGGNVYVPGLSKGDADFLVAALSDWTDWKCPS